MLNTDTPFAKAVFEMFAQLESALREKTSGTGVCKAYLFGGCALHIHTNARGSSDVDVELEALQRGLDLNDVILNLEPVFYEDPINGPSSLDYDLTFTSSLAPLHEDYQEDAIPLEVNEESPLWVYLVTKVDLAVSKLGRFGDQDIEDIYTLFDHGLGVEHFRQRAETAIRHAVGDERRLTGNLTYVINSYEPKSV